MPALLVSNMTTQSTGVKDSALVIVPKYLINLDYMVVLDQPAKVATVNS
jgi:hypothetical protein